MSLTTTTWIPGFEQHLASHGDAGSYTDLAHVKLIWHTSETAPGSLDGITRDMLDNQHTDTYHLAADPKLRRIAQYLPLNIAASALAHPAGTVETNHDGAIQVCIIGRATDMPALPAGDLEWLGTVVLAPIARAVPELHIDILATFYSDRAGFTLATPTARQRMAPAVWDNFNGQCGHQHAPNNDHWDPGGLAVDRITGFAHKVLHPTPPPVPKGHPMFSPPLNVPGGIAAMAGFPNSDDCIVVGRFGHVFVTEGRNGSGPIDPKTGKPKAYWGNQEVETVITDPAKMTADEKRDHRQHVIVSTSKNRYAYPET